MGKRETEQRATEPRRLPGIDRDRLSTLGLSRREVAVLELVARGHTNAQAAESLGISPLTVKRHLERMYAATGVPNRAALIALVSNAPTPPERAPASADLPAAPTSFVGREREIADVSSLLATVRLVTLSGAGGIGKTRLALEVAVVAGARHADGVRLVRLADLGDGRFVVHAAARALGLAPTAGARIDALVGELRAKDMLILFDNCEHLLRDGKALVERILRDCPRLRVLATSKQTLDMPGEALWGVSPLSLPAGARPDDVLRSEAGRLFLARARLRRPRLELTTATAKRISSDLPVARRIAARHRARGGARERPLARRSGRAARPASRRPPVGGPRDAGRATVPSGASSSGATSSCRATHRGSSSGSRYSPGARSRVWSRSAAATISPRATRSRSSRDWSSARSWSRIPVVPRAVTACSTRSAATVRSVSPAVASPIGLLPATPSSCARSRRPPMRSSGGRIRGHGRTGWIPNTTTSVPRCVGPCRRTRRSPSAWRARCGGTGSIAAWRVRGSRGCGTRSPPITADPRGRGREP